MTRFLSLLSLCAVLLPACLTDPEVRREAGTPEASDTGQKLVLGTPVAYDTRIDGLSGICLDEAGNGLLIAQDNGQVLEFDFNGGLLSAHVMPNPDGRSKVDLEGIARAADGTIYLCEERFREVYRLSADHKSLTLLSTGREETGSDDNQGYEGIAAGRDGVLYVANQSKPFRVYTYSVKTGAWATAFDPTWADSLSDIYFDDEDGTLWITDAKTQRLTQLSTGGTVIQHVDISFVKKPEGFCMDKARKLFWFVCDKTNRIYKVSYQ